MGARVAAITAGAAGAFAPLANRPDWFRVPREWIPTVAESPGVAWIVRTGAPMVHRSQLPLLTDHAEVAAYLAPRVANATEIAQVDQRTAPWKLRDYQHEGRLFIRERRGSLVADQMRLGKSAMSAAAHDPADGPLVVIGPLQAADVWMTWFGRLWPERRAVALTSRSYDPERARSADLIFVHFAILAAWQSLMTIKPSTLIIDEAHALSNRKSKLTQTVQFMSAMCGRVVLLTGTPFWNKPAGLYPLLTTIAPGAWGTWFEFAQRYCDGHPGSHGFVADGISNADELKERLSQVMLCRRWRDVKASLPTVTRDIRQVEITASQAQKIEICAEQIRVQGRARTQAGELARFRRLTGKLKVPVAIAEAARLMALGEHVILWTWHKDVAEDIYVGLNQNGAAAFRVDGDTPNAKRVPLFDLWRASEKPAALVLTMGIGQSAIDLSKARYEIFVEIDFTPAVVAQAEMRPYSPDLPMFVTYLCLDHPVDRRLISVLVHKCETAQEIGTPAAESAIDVLRQAFDLSGGTGDLQELQAALLQDMRRELRDVDEESVI